MRTFLVREDGGWRNFTSYNILLMKGASKMDHALLELIKADKKGEAKIEHLDGEGTIEVENDSGVHRYALKPLKELYGPGVNAATVDPESEEYMPLFLSTEEEVVDFSAKEPSLTGGLVQSAYDRLAIDPEAAAQGDRLVEWLQLNLRVQLSLNDYSRRDVQRVFRRLSKSVALHTREGGRHGYITFLRQFIR
jgi:hypothetical protein